MIPDQEEIKNVQSAFKDMNGQIDNALRLLDSCVLARREAESETKILQDRLAEVLRERDDWKIRAESLERNFNLKQERTAKALAKSVFMHTYTILSSALVIGLTIFFFVLLADYFNA